MSGKPNVDAHIYHTIYKVKMHWNELREHIQFSPSVEEAEQKWLLQLPFFQQLSFHNSIGIVLWNIVTNRFLFALDEKGVTKYDMSLYTQENGVDFSLANFHPQYMHAVQIMNVCFNELFSLLPHIPSDKIMCSFDALYRIQDGSYIHMLQQIVPVETDEAGHPILYLSYLRDITHLKKQPSASMVVSTPAECKLWKYCFESNVLEVVSPFTVQEKKVLQLLSEGKQTNDIAEKLQISPHTINTHRRHLLAKTNCVDTTALVAYAQLTGLL